MLTCLVACLWEKLTVVLVPVTALKPDTIEHYDARLIVTSESHLTPNDHCWHPQGAASPPQEPLSPLRESRLPPSPDARFLLTTSGTSGQPKIVALSDQNVLSVLKSHQPLLQGLDATVLSVLPWHHSFGLVLDLLMSMLSGSIIVRDGSGGKDPSALLQLLAQHSITHLNAVPLTVQKMLSIPGGAEALAALQGGVIGGAPISRSLAADLSTTNLRVGYGQTEASPGIMLGKPGQWSERCIGQPVGCEVRIDSERVLWFRGANACLGFWDTSKGLITLDSDRWVNTHDMVETTADGYRFIARNDDSFKLANGRIVHAGEIQASILDALREVEDVSLFSPDGQHVVAALELRGSQPVPPFGSVAAAMGSLGGLLSAVISVPKDLSFRSPKGSIDRRLLTARYLAA
jgi:long-subunit acyl-CoA synthetase (AMP-forming)